MTIEVEGPDGAVIEFPDNTSQDTIRGVMAKRYGGGQAAPQKPAARNWRDERPILSRIESGARGAMDSVSLGLDDEMAGKDAALEQLLRGNFGGMGDAYSQTRAKVNAQKAASQKRNPWSFGGGQFAGAVALPFGQTKTIANAAAKSGAYGGAYGFGSGEDLPDRLERAGKGAAASAALGGGAQGIFGRMRPTQAQTKLAEFEKAGVRPSLAAVNGGPFAGAAKMIEENLVAGIPARANTRRSIGDVEDAAARLAGRGATSPVLAGERVNAGVQSWARDTSRAGSFAQKAEALYDKALNTALGASKQPLRTQPATLQATERALKDIEARVAAPNIAQIVNPPILGKIRAAVDADGGIVKFDDIRALRTWVRNAKADEGLRQGIDTATLSRIEAALTDDIYHSAQMVGGPKALADLQRADKFYKAGMKRIETALKPFADKATGEGSYQRILQMAGEGSGANVRALSSLRRSLEPQDWRTVQSTIISRLGKSNAGAPDAAEDAFSLGSFVTNYAKMSPEGRRALFGGAPSGLVDELDNLAKVAGYQKGVEATANFSRSGVVGQNVGTGAAFVAAPAPTVGAILAGAVTGEMLTNPAFVRWVASASKAGNPAGLREQMRQLGFLASRDPTLQPAYQALAVELAAAPSVQSRPPAAEPRRAGALTP
jgi:hypothetical protein